MRPERRAAPMLTVVDGNLMTEALDTAPDGVALQRAVAKLRAVALLRAAAAAVHASCDD